MSQFTGPASSSVGLPLTRDPDQSQRLRVLIVEPSQQIVERLTQSLAALDVDLVQPCCTEDQAIERLSRGPVDVVVLELALYQGTAFGVMRHVRARGHTTALIVLTSHAAPALKVASFEAGADYFLDKAKDFAMVPRLIREIRELTADRRHASR